MTIIYPTPILKTCPYCHKEKPYYNNLQHYCRECAKIRRFEKSKENSARYRAISKEKRRKQTLLENPLSIDEVVKIAEQNKISYGKAVMLLSKEGA